MGGPPGVRKYTRGQGSQVLASHLGIKVGDVCHLTKARLKVLGQLEGDALTREDCQWAPMGNSKELGTPCRGGQHRGPP